MAAKSDRWRRERFRGDGPSFTILLSSSCVSCSRSVGMLLADPVGSFHNRCARCLLRGSTGEADWSPLSYLNRFCGARPYLKEKLASALSFPDTPPTRLASRPALIRLPANHHDFKELLSAQSCQSISIIALPPTCVNSLDQSPCLKTDYMFIYVICKSLAPG